MQLVKESEVALCDIFGALGCHVCHVVNDELHDSRNAQILAEDILLQLEVNDLALLTGSILSD